MKSAHRIFWPALVAAAMVSHGCDSGGGIMAGIDRGGVTGGAVGTVTGFGSVIVNGVRYDTTNAQIIVNGVLATESDLEIGYVVVLQAELPQDGSSPAATTIEFDHDVVGPIASITPTLSEFVVIGQTIRLDGATTFGAGIQPASVDGLVALPATQVVRVSGLRGDDGSLLATRVELGSAGADLEVTGLVSMVDAGANTLRIGALTVDYSGANLAGFGSGEPAVGDRVEAEGQQVGAGGALTATSLERKEIELSLDDGVELELEGLITSFTSTASFSVSGIPVVTNAQTEYENGSAATLGPDVRVEVEGRVDANGTLVADEVEFRQVGEARVEAAVESVDAAGGTLVVLGITVRTDASTSFEDKSPAELRPFSLSDLMPGDEVRVRGSEDAGGILATQIQRSEPLEELVLRGIATNVADPQFEILGVTVLTDAQTDLESDFFTTAEGRLVHVEGDTATGSFLAEKAEIED